jgi:hypothetical protein
MLQGHSQRLLALLGLGLLAVVAWRWSRPLVRRTGRSEQAAALAPARTGNPTRASSATPGDPYETEPKAPVLDRAKRDQMRALIWHAIGQPSPPDEPAPKRGAAYILPDRPPWPDAPGPGDAAPGIEPRYVQERVREDFFPVARKCYGDALERDPTLAGTIVLAFNIVGDAKTGGIVEAVDVLNESTLRDPEVIDCMRQSFLSVTFPPPQGGGEVTVKYPIVFSNDDGG